MEDTDKTQCSVFAPLLKIDESKREVWGVLAEEALDKTTPVPEIMDYEASKPHFQEWSAGFAETSGGKSLGNLRAMHDSKRAAGKLIALEFDDSAKKIRIGAKVVDDGDWKKVLEGVYLGFSIGGSYVTRSLDKSGATEAYRYTAKPFEASLCDLPCMPGAVIEMVRANGTSALRKIADDGRAFTDEPSEDEPTPPVSGEETPSGEEAAPVEKSSDPAAAEMTAETAIATLKALLAETAMLDGDPDTWTLARIVEAISAAVSAKYTAQVAAEAAMPSGASDSAQSTMQMSVAALEDFEALQKTYAESILTVNTITKKITDEIDAVLATIEKLQAVRETDATEREALVKTVSGMQETLDGVTQKVERIGSIPAMPGRAVTKQLGDAVQSDGASVTLAKVGEVVNRLVGQGKVTPEQERALRVELAALALR